MSGPLPPVSSLTTAILLNVLNGPGIGGNSNPPRDRSPDAQPARPDNVPDAQPARPTPGGNPAIADNPARQDRLERTPQTPATAAPVSTSAAERPRLANAASAPVMQEAARQLRQALPAQQPLPATLNRLWELFRSDRLPAELAPLRAQVRDAVRQLPSRESLSRPDDLRAALRNSGLFIQTGESSQPSSDLRQILSRLAEAFREHEQQAPAGNAPRPVTGTPTDARPAEDASPPEHPTALVAEPAPRPGKDESPGSEASPARGNPQAAAGQTPPDKQVVVIVETESPASAEAPATARTAMPAERAEPDAPQRGHDITPQRGGDSRINAYLPTPASGDDSVPGRLQPQARSLVADMQAGWDKAALGDMADLLRGNLARLDAHQLQSVQQAAQGHPQWLMELPVRDHDGLDLWQVHVQQERDSRGQGATRDADSTWQVTLSFCFERSGPMIARLRLQGENLQVTFHSEQPDTASWLQRHAGALEATLHAAGLSQVKVSQVTGLPHRDTLPDMTPATGLKVSA